MFFQQKHKIEIEVIRRIKYQCNYAVKLEQGLQTLSEEKCKARKRTTDLDQTNLQ